MTHEVLINGVASDTVRASDRGLHYGDGLFETIAITHGAPQFLDRHLDRLRRGARRLGLTCPPDEPLRDEIASLLNSGPNTERWVLKILLTRGPGGRGYDPSGAGPPTRILSRHPWPDHIDSLLSHGASITLSTARLGRNPLLAGIKHLNRLEQVLARQSLSPGFQEALMLDDSGAVIEAIAANVFFVQDGRVITPVLTECGVAGIIRQVLLERLPLQGTPVSTVRVTPEDALRADEIWLTNSLIGVCPVVRVNDRVLPAPTLLPRAREALIA